MIANIDENMGRLLNRLTSLGLAENTILYVCPKENLGATLRIEVGGKTLTRVVEEAHDPDPIPSPDRVPRGEVCEKVRAPLTMRIVPLDAGETRLALKAPEIPGGRACDPTPADRLIVDSPPG